MSAADMTARDKGQGNYPPPFSQQTQCRSSTYLQNIFIHKVKFEVLQQTQTHIKGDIYVRSGVYVP